MRGTKAMIRPTRRHFLQGTGALGAVFAARPLFAQVPVDTPVHGLSAFGDLKYPAGFTTFDYANPDAPKGGIMRLQPGNWLFNQNVQTFNTLNSFVRTGSAPPRMELCFDSLMAGGLDEPDSIYGLLAETVTISQDRNSFTFKLRPEARFHDGSPVTAEDVAFTYNLLKEEGHPTFLLILTELTAAEAVSTDEVRLVFSGKQSERTILGASTFPILSQKDMAEKPFDSSRIEAFLGSGPYKVGRFSAGRYIEYERVKDDWANDLPFRNGLFHFDQIRIDFYSDRNAAFEAFKKGETEWRGEFTSSVWATQYNFPAIRDGSVVKREFPSELRPSFYCKALNQRRERFRDPRVRRAISLCFDFEWVNRNLFYDLYERSQSPFEGSLYVAEGMPSKEELELLEPLRGRIPEEAFGEAVLQPTTDGSGTDRTNLREAARLMREAGWEMQGGSLQNASGERFTIEYLVDDETFLRISPGFIRNLRAIGIDANMRRVDTSQYQSRVTSFDYDLIDIAFSLGATPTRDTLLQFFHSSTVDIQGSNNFVGMADPAVDELVEIAANATNRDDFVIAMKSLDRVLRARLDWIPNWNAANHRVAYWNKFGFKEPKPDYGFPVEALWWYDEEKAKAIGK